MGRLEHILIDLETIWRSSREDYEAKRWECYPNYIDEFNSTLVELNRLEIDCDIDPIGHVPQSELSYGAVGMGTSAEIAKTREVADKSHRLLLRLKMLTKSKQTIKDPRSILENLFSKFHFVARQIRSRRENRATLEVKDEYDVQDLLHSLLKIFFDDIRPEEWTPSYAGGASRMDFLLKNEQTVVEVKKTREGLQDKKVGEQLIVDIEKYSKHPDCKNLVCFVYDPEGLIGNPRGVEADLMSRSDTKLQVEVYIRP